MPCNLTDDMNTTSQTGAARESMSRPDSGETCVVRPSLSVKEENLSILWDAIEEVTDEQAEYFREKRAMRAEDDATDEVEDDVQDYRDGWFRDGGIPW